MSVKINNLEIENVKRVKAVKIEPTTNGLTVIGGKNNQGKTSVLDAISWALGGDRFKPSNPQREGSAASPYLRVELSNGLIVERTGKNSALKVVDPLGNRNGQTLLNSFVEELAINLPKFMASNEIKDIKNYSKKVEDLYISENIRVISLGEATHGNADFQSLKFDILKNLV